jgi:nucleosome binding factor SPN SPT16 subunit
VLRAQISAQSNDKPLSFDVILVSLGTRYQMYCANASRTYMVDPSKKQARC